MHVSMDNQNNPMETTQETMLKDKTIIQIS